MSDMLQERKEKQHGDETMPKTPDYFILRQA